MLEGISRLAFLTLTAVSVICDDLIVSCPDGRRVSSVQAADQPVESLRSDHINMAAKLRNELWQGLRLQRVEIVLRRFRRIVESGAAIPGCDNDGGSVQSELLVQEVVRMDNVERITARHCQRKVSEVHRDDAVGAGVDGCREDVPIIGVWKIQGRYQVFVTLDEAAEHRVVHQLTGAGEALGREIGPVRQQVPNPLLMDPVRPARPENAVPRQLKQEVPQRSRVKDAGVQNDCVACNPNSPSSAPEPRPPRHRALRGAAFPGQA